MLALAAGVCHSSQLWQAGEIDAPCRHVTTTTTEPVKTESVIQRPGAGSPNSVGHPPPVAGVILETEVIATVV